MQSNGLKLNENKYTDVTEVPSVVNSDEAQRISQQIADESITLVKNEGSIVPFTNSIRQNCLIISLNNGNEKQTLIIFSRDLIRIIILNQLHIMILNGDISNSDDILKSAEGFDVIIIPIYAKVKIKTGTVGLPESQISLINSLVGAGKKGSCHLIR